MNASLESLRALALAVALHAGLVALIWFASLFAGGQATASGAPGPIQASLQVSGADLERARAAIRAAEQRAKLDPAEQMHPLPPQATPSPDATSELPLPAESDDAPTLALQAWMAEPEPGLEEALASLDQPQPEDAGGPTHGDSAEAPHGDTANGAGDAAQAGVDSLLEARYLAAIQAVTQASWDPGSSPAGVHCEVRFTQATGGKVVAIEFLDCPYDAAARKAVERALLTASLPYAGFESVFARHQQETVVYCHPQEACAH